MSDTALNGVRIRSGRSRKSATPFSIGRIMMLLGGLVMLVLALPPFFSFPWLGFWLLPMAAIYLLLLLVLPRLWLFVLPLATVGVDVTPWTGRFAYNELDLLFLVTLASGLLYGRYRFKVYAPTPAIIVLLLYLVVIALGYAGWTLFALPPGAAYDNPYYTSEYSYKVLKGIVWGIGLVPMWGYLLAVDKKSAVNALVTGICLAALLLGLLVLWERGTLGVLLSGGAWYHVVSSLLDLTSAYRVTGLFSDMHTGGEVVDGVLLLFLPVTLHGAVYGWAVWIRLLSAVGLLALGYVTLVGFTRATYVAFVIALLCYGALALRSRRISGLGMPVPLTWLAGVLGAGIVAAVLAYRLAGSYGLASYGALLLLSYAANRVQLQGVYRHTAWAVAALLVGLAINAHLSSRWVEPSITGGVLLVASLAVSYVLAQKLFGKCSEALQIDRLFILGGIIVFPLIFAFALGGYQINDRFTRVSGDLETRQSHWRDVLDSAGGFLQKGIGNGVGSFPVNYIGAHPQKVQQVGSFRVAREQRRDVLRLGGGRDLTVGQRVAIQPHTIYNITVRLRADQSGRATISLCERNLIYASNFMPHCVHEAISFEATEGAFEAYSMEINSGQVGERGALRRWPTVMTLRYGKVGTVLDVDSIEFATDGFNVLRNGSFNGGLDYWFYYNDFSHLPWHVKNTFLQVWFETGWLGLVLFVALIGLLLRATLERRRHDSLAMVYATGVVTLCLFGMFGSPLDSARVAWIFYFFLGAGLAKLRVGRKSRSAGNRPVNARLGGEDEKAVLPEGH